MGRKDSEPKAQHLGFTLVDIYEQGTVEQINEALAGTQQQYSSLLLSIGKHYGSFEDAEEIANTTLERLNSALLQKRYDPNGGTLASYLARIAINLGVGMVRARNRRSNKETVPLDDYENRLSSKDNVTVPQEVRDMLAVLEPHKQIVVSLYVIHQFTLEEIGKAFGKNKSTILRWYREAIEELRKHRE